MTRDDAPVDGGPAPAATAVPTTAPSASGAPSIATTAPIAGAAVKVGTPGKATRTHRLTVTIHGAGRVRGRVQSVPAGIDCVADVPDPGTSTKTCHATLPAGRPITLRFVPADADSPRQYSEGTRAICDSRTCTIELVGDATITVHTISVPPFPPRKP